MQTSDSWMSSVAERCTLSANKPAAKPQTAPQKSWVSPSPTHTHKQRSSDPPLLRLRPEVKLSLTLGWNSLLLRERERKRRKKERDCVDQSGESAAPWTERGPRACYNISVLQPPLLHSEELGGGIHGRGQIGVDLWIRLSPPICPAPVCRSSTIVFFENEQFANPPPPNSDFQL